MVNLGELIKQSEIEFLVKRINKSQKDINRLSYSGDHFAYLSVISRQAYFIERLGEIMYNE